MFALALGQAAPPVSNREDCWLQFKGNGLETGLLGLRGLGSGGASQKVPEPPRPQGLCLPLPSPSPFWLLSPTSSSTVTKERQP